MKISFFIIFILIVFSSCYGDRPEPKFSRGELVVAIVSNDTGMVVREYWWRSGWEYEVRFSGKQSYTDTHILSSDGVIGTYPLALVEMREFELRKVYK